MFDFQVFQLTLEKVGVMLLMMGIGYFFRARKIVGKDASKLLALLITNLFNPAYTFNSLSTHFTRDKLGENLVIVAVATGLLFAVSLISRLLGKILGRDDFERRSLTYLFAFPNNSFFGYPVIQGVFGDEMLAKFIVFCLPVSLALFSYGYALFAGASGEKAGWKKTLLSPVFLSCVLGCVFGLLSCPLPDVVLQVIETTGNCISTVSMLTAGVVLGAFPLKSLLTRPRPYLYSALRLVGLTVLFGVPMYFLGIRGTYLFLSLLFLSLPVALNTVVYPESFGIDAPENARTCFVSLLLSIVTLPAVFAILAQVCGMNT
ncbi:MAG: AEC family transporter [Clostridia bacterium]|nr:AEC family transporter [Clostridia bacterium]